MCGIGMALGVRDPLRFARTLADALAHRGPDDVGIEPVADRTGSVRGALTHRRLSILDLSPAGHQPMASRDGRWVIAFNGEIYNFAELRAELARGGVLFRGGSDTEVLVEGIAREGMRFLERLRGMYALALWDRVEGCGYVARDPFGIKPLYLTEVGGGVIVASELRALLATGVVPRTLSARAVREYLAWGSVPEPATIVEDVRMLPAGTYARARVEGNGAYLEPPVSIRAPWGEPPARLVRDRAEALALVRESLADSVARHLVSDVPVAVFLSGGIDSSAVAALASRAATRPLDSFTITFGEAEYDEARFARAIAVRFGTRHHEIRLTEHDLYAELPAALQAMDQPSLDGLNTYSVSKAVRSHGLEVVLSGLGGDELFAGYPAFRRAARGAALARTPAALRRAGARVADRLGGVGGKLALLLRADDPSGGAYSASRALYAGRSLDALAPGAPVSEPRAPAGLSPLQAVSWHELTRYMRNTLLRDSDVFSMAHALELRVPFVDAEVARAAMAVDDALKLSPGRSKPLLVDALGDLLPREVWDRPKQGFVLPFERWMHGVLRDEVAGALRSPARMARAGIAPAAARAVWEGFLAGRAGLSWGRPWALYTLVRWAEQNDASAGELAAAPALAVAGAVGA